MIPLAKVSLRIIAHGFNELARNTLQHLFSGPGGNAYRLVHDNGEADLCIFNFDCVNAAALWEKFRTQHPHLPSIVMSVQTAVPADAVFLRKPMVSADLLRSIEQLRVQAKQAPLKKPAEISHKAVPVRPPPSTRSAASAIATGIFERDIFGLEPDVDLASPGEIERISYDPTRYYQDLVSNVIRKTLTDQRPRVIEGLLQRFEPIIVFPAGGGTVFTKLGDNTLRNLCSVPVDEQGVTVREVAGDDRPPSEMKATSAKAFQWKMALWSSRGRLPFGTDIHLPMQLSHWPNFTRVLTTPHAMRIAALMVASPVSLADVSRILALPQRNVFTFFSAASATIGFDVAPGNESAASKKTLSSRPVPERAQTEATAHRGFLSRMLGRLMNAQ